MFSFKNWNPSIIGISTYFANCVIFVICAGLFKKSFSSVSTNLLIGSFLFFWIIYLCRHMFDWLFCPSTKCLSAIYRKSLELSDLVAKMFRFAVCLCVHFVPPVVKEVAALESKHSRFDLS